LLVNSLKNIIVRIAIGFIYLIGLLPLSVAQAFGRVIGRFLWLTKGNLTHITLTNLKLCFPDKSTDQINQLAKKSLLAYGQTVIEMGMAWTWPIKKVQDIITEVEGIEYLEQALANKKGILLLAPHHGNWELLNHFFHQYLAMTVMYKPAKIAAINDFVFKTRKRLNIGLAPANRRGVGMIFKVLKEHGTVAILPDQEPDVRSGVFADFFSHSALTGRLAGQIAKKTDAYLLCCYALRLDNGNYKVVLKPALESIRDDDPLVAANALNKSVEYCILDSPEQYQWVYKRFTQQPGGHSGVYFKSTRMD